MKRLTCLFHGDSGSGKSWLADTCPGPRLLLDSEGRAEYTPSPKVYWNPREALPSEGITTDTTVVVDVREYGDLMRAKQWLESGDHYFKSLIVDSLTDVQEQLLADITGDAPAEMRDWGDLFKRLNNLVLSLKDLRRHPKTPLDMVVFLAGSDERNGKQRPYLQGQLGKKIPYRVDLVGYLTVARDAATGTEYRSLAITAAGVAEAKDGTGILSAHYGPTVTNPDLSQMLEVLNQTDNLEGNQ